MEMPAQFGMIALECVVGQVLDLNFEPDDRDARSLPNRRPPAWVYLHGIKSPLSSTAIRQQAPEGRRSAPEKPAPAKAGGA